jgi:hypothetical protein
MNFMPKKGKSLWQILAGFVAEKTKLLDNQGI